MKRNKKSGVAIVEFSFGMLIIVPLLIGTVATGLNLIQVLSTVQLARDAGHMYARGTDFSQPGNKTVLATIGSTVGMSATSGAGRSVIILSIVTYVDKPMCAAAGKVDAGGNPSGCTNYTKWVFTQRLTIGLSTVRASSFGSPQTSGNGSVTVDSTTGKISLNDQVTKTGDVATFAVGINPYANVSGVVSGLPSGQVIYISESATTGMSLPPFVPGSVVYSYAMF
ncbi:MAG: hypothetical protein ABI806_05470 [Candidatus Solibacter sp.]